MRDAIRGRGERGGGGRGGRRGKEEKERGHTGQESEGRLARHSPLPWAAPCVSPSSHLCQTPPIRPPEKAFRTPATAHGICMATIHCMTLLVLASPGSYACHTPTRYPPRPRRHSRAKHTTEPRRPHIPQQTKLIVRSYGRRRPLPATASPGCVSHPSKNKWLRPRHVRFRLAHTRSHSAYHAHMYTHSLHSHHS